MARETSLVVSAGNATWRLWDERNWLKVSKAMSYKRAERCSGSAGREATISFSEMAFPARALNDGSLLKGNWLIILFKDGHSKKNEWIIRRESSIRSQCQWNLTQFLSLLFSPSALAFFLIKFRHILKRNSILNLISRLILHTCLP